MPAAHLRGKFAGWVECWIQFAVQLPNGIGQGGGDGGGGRGSDHHDVHIAGSAVRPPRERAEDKGQLNLACDRLQRRLQHVGKSDRFDHDRSQLFVDRRACVGPVEQLMAGHARFQKAQANEQLELALRGPQRGAG
jgi:hypothetical protein